MVHADWTTDEEGTI